MVTGILEPLHPALTPAGQRVGARQGRDSGGPSFPRQRRKLGRAAPLIGRCILSQSVLPRAGPERLTWRLRPIPTQWRWEPLATCKFLRVLPDSGASGRTDPRLARHGSSVPPTARAPAAAAAARTSGPLALRGTSPRPLIRALAPSPVLSCRSFLLSVVPATLYCKNVCVQSSLSGSAEASAALPTDRSAPEVGARLAAGSGDSGLAAEWAVGGRGAWGQSGGQGIDKGSPGANPGAARSSGDGL